MTSSWACTSISPASVCAVRTEAAGIGPAARSASRRATRAAPRGAAPSSLRLNTATVAVERALGGLLQDVDDAVDVRVGEAGVDADPEHALHDEVRVVERADDAVLDVLVGRLAQQVAGEQQARGDPAVLERADDRVAVDRRLAAHGDREAEPRRVGV